MRKIGISVIFLVALATPLTLWAQIPNPGFETWSGTGAAMQPTGWTNYWAAYLLIPNFANPLTQSASSHSGSYSLRGSVVNFPGYLGIPATNVPPWVTATFPFKQRPAQLTGWYQLNSVQFDSLVIVTSLQSTSGGTLYAGGEWGSNIGTTGWTKFTIPIAYSGPGVPDSGTIIVVMDGRDTIHVGSYFLLDDLAFEGTATGVAEQNLKPAVFALHQNYPNPFNPTTTITYEIAKPSLVKLSVFDLLGREVATLVNERRDAGSYQVRFDASTLPSGMYFYRLEAGSFVQTRRLALVK